MKLITLLTTLIITLASSNVFAQKFLCENWREYKGKDVYENKGSLFVGEKIDDTITIEDQYGKKLTYTYLGDAFVSMKYYTNNDESYMKIIMVSTGKSFDAITKQSWDLSIREIDYSSKYVHTHCNWQ